MERFAVEVHPIRENIGFGGQQWSWFGQKWGCTELMRIGTLWIRTTTAKRYYRECRVNYPISYPSFQEIQERAMLGIHRICRRDRIVCHRFSVHDRHWIPVHF